MRGGLGGTTFESHLYVPRVDVVSAGTSTCAPFTAQNVAELVNGVKGTQFGILVGGYTVSREQLLTIFWSERETKRKCGLLTCQKSQRNISSVTPLE